MSHMREEFVIIGGGVAGLSAAIRLAELGAHPVVLEAGSYPAHKVCGEFLSPECIPQLHQWGIEPVKIQQMSLHTPQQTLTFDFPYEAGSLSHLQLDPALLQVALEKGATVRTQVKVNRLSPYHLMEGFYELELSNGETLKATHLILATGRLPSYQLKPPKVSYVGIKAHFSHLPIQGKLEMFTFPGAYLGIAPIEENKFNIAGLAKIKLFTAAGSPEALIQRLMSQQPLLKQYLSEGHNLFPTWMHTPVPAFGIKSTPDWPHAYFIGDAIATIPPATGSGLSLAILGGCLAAEHAIKDDFVGFKQAWHKRYAPLIRWGKLLHYAMLHPQVGSRFIPWFQRFPSLAQHAFHLTRYIQNRHDNNHV